MDNRIRMSLLIGLLRVGRSGTLNDVFVGVTPFYIAIASMIALLLAWPSLAFWLPTMMYR